MFTNENAIALAKQFQPILFFDPTERFFPIAPEEWLTHVSPESWNNPETHQRGTALLKVNQSDTVINSSNLVAGSDHPSGAALQLNSTSPEGINQNFSFDPTVQDLFLDIAGWNDVAPTLNNGPRFSQGSTDYLDLLFRTVSNNMNPVLPIDSADPTPSFSVPRINSPTLLAEVEWAGIFPRIDNLRAGQTSTSPDFPSAIGTAAGPSDQILKDLDNYIALTYYMLYPAMEAGPGVLNDGVLKKEGQWEAITLFIKGRKSDSATDRDGRPEFFMESSITNLSQTFTPRFAVYSQGYHPFEDNSDPLKAAVRPFQSSAEIPSVTNFSNHVLAYITAGTHKNLFAPEEITTPGTSTPNTTLNPLGGAIMGAAGTAAGVCLGLAPPPLTPACIVCLIIAAVVFLIGLILFLLSFLMQSTPPATEAPDPGSTDVARDGGSAALPPGQNAPIENGLQPAGNSVTVNLRVINRFGFDTPGVSTYPAPPETVEFPSWFTYPGRWGVRIMNFAGNTWDSGSRRIDPTPIKNPSSTGLIASNRSRAYWNAYRLVEFLNDPARQIDGITV